MPALYRIIFRQQCKKLYFEIGVRINAYNQTSLLSIKQNTKPRASKQSVLRMIQEKLGGKENEKVQCQVVVCL